jgi:hypothetical protein
MDVPLSLGRDVDQISSAGRIARQTAPRAEESQHAETTAQIRARMVDRVWFVGSNETTAPLAAVEKGLIVRWMDPPAFFEHVSV